MQKRSHYKIPWLGYLLILPQILITILFFFYPAAEALIQSFLLSDPFGQISRFVAFENYRFLIEDPEYFLTFLRTLFFGLMVSIISMGFGLLFAVCASRIQTFKTFFRALFIYPYAVAPVMAGMLWLFLFHPSFGVMGFILNQVLNLGWNPVLNGNHALIMVIVASSWKQISYNFVFFLGALQAVPKSILEAASIDGASPVQRFWRMTFPLMSPTVFFLIVMNFVYAIFDTFGVIHTTTSGGPGGSTQILVYKVYADGFVGLDMGASSAQSVVLMILTVILMYFQFRFVEKKVQY